MKFVKLFIVALLLPVFFYSCKKDQADPTYPVEGTWEGVYGFDNDVPSISYRLNIKHGGVIEELYASGQSKGGGNWSFAGNKLHAHYQWKSPLNTIFTIDATYDPPTQKLTGTWGYDNSSTDGGKWEATRSN